MSNAESITDQLIKTREKYISDIKAELLGPGSEFFIQDPEHELLMTLATGGARSPHPTRLLCPWDSPGKNTGVGCHFLLQCMKVKSEREVAQCDPMDCSLPGSSVHGIFQPRVLEWGAIAFSDICVCVCVCIRVSNTDTP